MPSSHLVASPPLTGLLLIPADPRCRGLLAEVATGLHLMSPIPCDGIKQSGSLAPQQEADSNNLDTGGETMGLER